VINCVDIDIIRPNIYTASNLRDLFIIFMSNKSFIGYYYW